VPTSSVDVDVKPYRYIFTGYINDVGEVVSSAINDAVKDLGFFSTMSVTTKCNAEPKSGIFYSTFFVEAEYSVKFPLKILGMEIAILKFNSYSEVPITDVGEFIRNIDMAIDYIESSKVIQDAMGKAKEFLGSLQGGTK